MMVVKDYYSVLLPIKCKGAYSGWAVRGAPHPGRFGGAKPPPPGFLERALQQRKIGRRKKTKYIVSGVMIAKDPPTPPLPY